MSSDPPSPYLIKEVLIDNLVTHEIFAGNLVLGPSKLIDLNLPDRWQLAPGVSRPEVNAVNRPDEDLAWVVNGNAWYVVYETEEGWALELALNIRPGNEASFQPAGEPFSISGHPAEVSWKVRRRGLPWRRHDVTFMTVAFSCPQTERKFKLEFSGWCPAEGFTAIRDALRTMRCH